MIQTELLSAEKILEYLDPSVLKHIAHIEILPLIDSTNSYLLREIKENSRNKVVFAEEQKAGRGRLEKKWISAKGNLAFSILWRGRKALPTSILSLVIGVCVVHALSELGLTHGVKIKWPNDIYVQGKKLGGILIESKKNYLVIGVGLNVIPCESIAKLGISLQEILPTLFSRNKLAALLLKSITEGVSKFEKSGFKNFRTTFQKFDFLFEKEIRVCSAGVEDIGIAKGITEQGELILLKENGDLAHYCYGDISVKI